MLKEKSEAKESKKVEFLTWRDVVNKPFPKLGPITEKTRERVKKYARLTRGAVRLRKGQVLTDEKREQRRKRAEKSF